MYEVHESIDVDPGYMCECMLLRLFFSPALISALRADAHSTRSGEAKQYSGEAIDDALFAKGRWVKEDLKPEGDANKDSECFHFLV